MELRGRTVAITGGGSGIGAAYAARFVEEDPAGLVLVDVDEDGVAAVAEELGVRHVVADLATLDGVTSAVAAARDAVGELDVWVSNAGVGIGGGVEAPEEGWQRSWDVNVLAGVRAARLLAPGWVERGGGVFVSTVSAAGLLNHVLSAPYAATKAAALSFAENLAFTHGDRGVRVVAVCPQGVRTPMLDRDPSGFLEADAIAPADVAEALVAALADDRRFLVLPHPEVADHALLRARDHDRWVGGMRKLRRGVVAGFDGDASDWR